MTSKMPLFLNCIEKPSLVHKRFFSPCGRISKKSLELMESMRRRFRNIVAITTSKCMVNLNPRIGNLTVSLLESELSEGVFRDLFNIRG